MNEHELEYAGFWIRTLAAIIDSILVLIIIVPIVTAIYGIDYWGGESAAQGFGEFLFNYIILYKTVFYYGSRSKI